MSYPDTGSEELSGAFQARFTCSPPDETPVPVRPIVVEAPVEELLVRTSAPEAALAAVGSNCTSSTAVWFGARVSGKLAPVTENPAPLTAALFTVTASVPLEVKISACVAGEFRFTLPNPIVAELTLSVEAEPAPTPVPLRLTTVEVPVAELLLRINVPEVAPAAAGSNCTAKVAV